MAQSVLDILLRTKREGSGTKEETDNLKKFGETIDTVKKNALGMAAGLTAAFMTFKKAMDLGEAGAEVAQMGESWDFLMEKIGASPTLLEELRAASHGTISDMEMMTSTVTLLTGASDEMAKELADAAPAIMEIAKAAVKLKPELKDVGFVYESLMTGIKRGSPLMIDNSGVTFTMGEAYAEFAEELGKSADELTSNEQKMALLTKTVKSGAVMIAQVGGDTAAATDSFQRLRAEVENLWNAFKAKLFPQLAKAAEGMYVLLIMGREVTQAKKENARQTALEAKSYDEYVISMLETKKAAYGLTNMEERMLVVMRDKGKTYAEVIAMGGDYANSVEHAMDKMKGLTEAEYEHLQAIAAIEAAYPAAAEGAALLARTQGQVAAATVQETEAELLAAEEIIKARQERYEAITEINQNRISQIEKFSQIEGDYHESLMDANEELADVEEELADARAAGYAETGTKIQELIAKQEELKGSVEEIEAAHALATKSIILGYLEQKMAADGVLTDAETEWLLAKGVEWGIYEETAVEAYQNAAAAADEAMSHFYDKTATLTVDFIQRGSNPIFSSGTSNGNQGTGGRQMAAGGGQFMIPSGYPADTYPLLGNVNAQSGEMVTVTPVGQSVPGNQTVVQVYLDSTLIQQVIGDQLSRQGVIR